MDKGELLIGTLLFCNIIRLTLNRKNEVYVIDYAAQEKYKQSIWDANPEQEKLTSEQYDEFQRILARTLVPINDYKGDYEQPAVVIRRELSLSEIEISVKKKKPSYCF